MSNNIINVPAHTAAVFVKTQTSEQGNFICNPVAGDTNQPGCDGLR